MGSLEKQLHDKLQAIRQLIPKGTKAPETISEVKAANELIWKEVRRRNRYVVLGGKKVVHLARKDLEAFEEMGKLYLRKKELEPELAASTSG